MFYIYRLVLWNTPQWCKYPLTNVFWHNKVNNGWIFVIWKLTGPNLWMGIRNKWMVTEATLSQVGSAHAHIKEYLDSTAWCNPFKFGVNFNFMISYYINVGFSHQFGSSEVSFSIVLSHTLFQWNLSSNNECAISFFLVDLSDSLILCRTKRGDF